MIPWGSCVLWLGYPLQNGIWSDVSKHDNDGIITGAVWEGDSLYFDGLDDLVNGGNDISLNITTGITLEANVKTASVIDYGPKVIVKPAGSGWSSPYFYYCLGMGHGAEIKAQFAVITNTNEIYSGVLNADQWYHIVGTYDGLDQRLYVDGNEVNSLGVTGSIPTSSQPIAIGARSTTNINERFNGHIKRAVIYNKALSAQQVKEAYQQTYRLL